VSSSLEKIPQNPPISLALRPETIRHPDKRSKLENDATCGLADRTAEALEAINEAVAIAERLEHGWCSAGLHRPNTCSTISHT